MANKGGRGIDAMVKPILDGLKQVIYEDDGEIYKLTSQRIDLKLLTPIETSGELLDGVLDDADELVHIVVIWETEEV